MIVRDKTHLCMGQLLDDQVLIIERLFSLNFTSSFVSVGVSAEKVKEEIHRIMETKLAFCLVLLAFVASGSSQAVRFKVAARDLKAGDLIWGPPDPAARIYYAFGSNDFTRVSETETQHTANPTWPDEFSFQYVSDLNQRVKIEIIENDAFFDDKYGEVTFTMNTLVGSGTLEADLNGKGTLVVTYY